MQIDHTSLGSPAYSSGQMTKGNHLMASRQNKLCQWFKATLHGINLHFQSYNIFCLKFRFLYLVFAWASCQCGSHDEQNFLDFLQEVRPLTVDFLIPQQSYMGIKFIHGSVG